MNDIGDRMERNDTVSLVLSRQDGIYMGMDLKIRMGTIEKIADSG